MSRIDRFIYGTPDAMLIDGTGLNPDPELTARNLARAKEVIRKMGPLWCLWNDKRASQDQEDERAAHSHTGEE